MGLGTAKTWQQSKGRLPRDQMMGWTLSWRLREMATMLQVSARTAVLLQYKVCNDSSFFSKEHSGNPIIFSMDLLFDNTLQMQQDVFMKETQMSLHKANSGGQTPRSRS
jgi:hypothetical protein